MTLFFYICSALCFLGAAITALNVFYDGSYLLFTLLIASGGLLFFQIASLRNRIYKLENKVNGHAIGKQSDFCDTSLPQVRCMKCGKTFDFDYNKCPFCGGERISKPISSQSNAENEK